MPCELERVLREHKGDITEWPQRPHGAPEEHLEKPQVPWAGGPGLSGGRPLRAALSLSWTGKAKSGEGQRLARGHVAS